MLISELLEHFQLEAAAPLTEDFPIKGVRPLAEAGPSDLSFLSNPKYKAQLLTTQAAAVLVREPVENVSAVQIITKEPYVTLAKILQKLYPEPERPAITHPSAVIDPRATIGPGCYIGPNCVIEGDTQLGANNVLIANVTILGPASIGDRVTLFPNVVLYPKSRLGNGIRIHANTVIGSDGFGYAQHGGEHHKVPQIGGVRIGDNVEIGSNTSIDRGALSDTVIGEGSKIDNLVQIAHGVRIGACSLLVSQTGISGSTNIGRNAILAGKVGTVGHVTIGDNVLVMGDSVVTKDLKKPGRYAGNPAVPHMKYQRQLALVRKLPELLERIKALEENNEKGSNT